MNTRISRGSEETRTRRVVGAARETHSKEFGGASPSGRPGKVAGARDACRGAPFEFDPMLPLYGAVDAATKEDSTAAVLAQ